MKKFTLLTLIIAFTAALSMQSFAQVVLYEDGFDDMTAGEYFVLNQDAEWWQTWSDTPGTDEDAFVSDEQSSSPSNSVEMEGISDLMFLCGNKTSGKYQVEVEYYVVSGFGGHINLQHFEVPGIEWAVQIMFGAAIGSENGYMEVGGEVEPFTFLHDQWLQLKFIVDLDEDWTEFLIDDVLIFEWPFSYTPFEITGTKQLGAVNIYAGAPEGDTPHYYFDNLIYTELIAGSVAPIIEVNDSPIVEIIEEGEVQMMELEMGNLGEDDLVFDIVVNYDLDLKSTAIETQYVDNYPKSNSTEVIGIPNPNAVTQNNNGERDEVLRYDDGTNAFNIGNDSEQVWRVAARFTGDILMPYIGMEIFQVDVFMGDAGILQAIQIYGMGPFITPGPGDLLYEQGFDPMIGDWTAVPLDENVIIDGQNLWVGYLVDKPGGVYPAGADAVQDSDEGNWISNGLALGWGHLSSEFGDWNIAAHITGELAPQWLFVDPNEGTLMQDETVTLEITLDATELTESGYVGKINIRNNDPLNEEVTIPVSMVVIVGVDENPTNEYIMVYPNPATDLLRISNNNGLIDHIMLTNTVGQIVVDEVVNAPNVKINMSNLPKGVYFATIETANGTATQKVIVE